MPISYWEIAVFVASLIFFGSIILFKISSDIQVHAYNLSRSLTGNRSFPPAFLYFLMIYIFSCFSTQPYSLYFSSVLTLAMAVTAKFMITRSFIAQQFHDLGTKEILSDSMIGWLSVMLCLASSLPTAGIMKGFFYAGQTAPNVWHNSTTIFLMPFALLLFWYSYKQLESPMAQRIPLLTILCLLNIFAKPSYFLVFFLLYPMMLIKRFGVRRELWMNLIPVAVGMIAVTFEYYLLYHIRSVNMHGETSGITISLFTVWSHTSPNIAFSIVASILFPLLYLLFYWRELFENDLLLYAMVGYLLAIVIASLFAETGPREFDGNFGWQAKICNYFLFMVVSVLFAKKIAVNKIRNWGDGLISFAFIAHVIFGVLYLGKIFATGSYK